MERRTLLTLLGGAAASGVGVRAMAQAPGAPRTITFGMSTSIIALDPAHGGLSNYPGGYEAALCIYDKLLDFDADMRIVPQLAESYEMAADLRSCRIALRRNVRFHDGTPFDAEAVKFNVERSADRTRTPTNRPLWDPVAGCDIVDPHTVVIRMSVAFSQLPNTLAHGSGAMVSPAAVQRLGERGIAQAPVGAGPFMVDSFSAGQSLTLRAFDGYWAGRPATDRLVFQFIAEAATRVNALRTGSADVIDGVPVQLIAGLRRDANLEVITRPGLRPMGLALNLSRPPLDDVRVRRALNLAIPVQTIAERVFMGFARAPDSPLAFDTTDYRSVSPLRFDQAAARALLAEAGFRPGAGGMLQRDGRPLRLDLFTPEGLFPGDVAVTEIVANALRQVGVEAVISRIERGAYWDQLRQERANLRWDMAMFGFNPSNASGLYHLESLFRANPDDAARPAVWNIGRYRNPRVDDLLNQANSTADRARQAAALGEVQQIVWDDVPYVWLQVNENAAAVRRGVQGVYVLPIVFTVVRVARR